MDPMIVEKVKEQMILTAKKMRKINRVLPVSGERMGLELLRNGEAAASAQQALDFVAAHYCR